MLLVETFRLYVRDPAAAALLGLLIGAFLGAFLGHQFAVIQARRAEFNAIIDVACARIFEFMGRQTPGRWTLFTDGQLWVLSSLMSRREWRRFSAAHGRYKAACQKQTRDSIGGFDFEDPQEVDAAARALLAAIKRR